MQSSQRRFLWQLLSADSFILVTRLQALTADRRWMGAERDRGSASQQLRGKPSVRERERQGSRLRSSSTEVGQMKWMLFPWRRCPRRRSGAWCAPQAQGGWDAGSGGCWVGWSCQACSHPLGESSHPLCGWGVLNGGAQVRSWLSRTHLNLPALPARSYEPQGLIVGLLFPPSQVGSPEQPAPLSWNGGSTEAVSLE